MLLFRHLLLAISCFAPVGLAWGTEPIKVPMTADHWTAHGDMEFVPLEGFPQGMLILKKGTAALKDLRFSDGTIEFDVDAYTAGMPAILFRERDADTTDEFYLRTGQNCPASDDCIQYAPKTHGVMLWNLFPEYQTLAPVMPKQWNHVKLVISGARMNVFINRSAAPSLCIGRLEGDAAEGGLSLRGPGTFANLVVTPGAVEGLPPAPLVDPADQDPRYVRNWLVSAPFVVPPVQDAALQEPVGSDPVWADMPGDGAGWSTMAAERYGLVNLNRRYGSPVAEPAISGVWLKTVIVSDRDQTKRVAIGYGREVWVSANGKQVFSGRNLYDPPSARQKPDGRTSLENGAFDLPLRKGRNDIVVVLDNNTPLDVVHYGWGLEMRLDDITGVDLGAAAEHS